MQKSTLFSFELYAIEGRVVRSTLWLTSNAKRNTLLQNSSSSEVGSKYKI